MFLCVHAYFNNNGVLISANRLLRSRVFNYNEKLFKMKFFIFKMICASFSEANNFRMHLTLIKQVMLNNGN